MSTTSKVNEENLSPTEDNDNLKISQKYITPRSILRSEVNLIETNTKNESVTGTEKDENILKANEFVNSTSTDKIHKDSDEIVTTTSNILNENTSYKITTENIVQRNGNSKDTLSDVKQSLRNGDTEHFENTFTPKYFLKSPNVLASSTENSKTNKNSPFVPLEQVNSKLVEEPHYVPVYNYDPSNAFYTGYNYFGPNYGENDKSIEINTDDKVQYKKFNKHNFIADYTKKQAKNQNNRNLKFYDSKNGNFKPRSAAYQNNLLPAWKGGFSDISFNPNDYLDLDYYVGRTNDDIVDEDVHETPHTFVSQQLRESKSEDVIDPDASLEHYNIKDKITALRNALYLHKYKQGKKPKLSNVINKNYQLKTKFTKWKQNFDPILRGLDDTFLIFLPGGKAAGGRGAHDDKNIAVDYYFSRMNSEEQPLSDSNETYYKPIHTHKRIATVDESKQKNTRTLEKVKDTKYKVAKEKRIQIPLSPDNILKIDLTVKDGNNVNVIFRNVKKPEPDKFEVYLNSYVTVMKDMIEQDNKGLQQYHWLSTTVDIQSAIDKLMLLTEALKEHEELHYSDFELIKYILFVFQTSNKFIKEDADNIQRSKNKEDKIVKSPQRAVSNGVGGDADQSLKTLRKIYEDIKEIQEMSVTMSGTALIEFQNFLLDLQSSLNKLHEAVKEIATITNYKKQNWFYDLKHLYLLPVERDISLTLLLHLATSKLFGVIEDGAKKGLEDNFIIFVKNHREEVERTRDDFIFVLRLLRAIKKPES
ncbi:hypothetical protein RR46_12750 [Papilio xuthus]|uniref:Uncharacterized protein n=1 Tax=Papilio xuthus TaxID=66420 RepID=A0A194PZX3_PAPXU|nr:hypothetical protein RR46_12750 [Papilio xuthus]